MPGTPATSPHYAVPRYADSDAASFSSQVNGVTDQFDAQLGARDEVVTVRSANYTASPGDCVICTQTITVTLPTAPTVASSAVHVIALSHDCTVSRGGSDTITDYATTSATSVTVKAGTRMRFLYSGTTWYAMGHEQPIPHAATHEYGGSDPVAGIPAPGDIIASAASTRAGSLLCDGSAVSRTTYAALFAAIGTAFGSGNGSTTFNVPDLRGRSPMGAGTGAGLSARSLAQNVGEENHTLTQSQIPGHSHGYSGSSVTGTENQAHNHSATSETYFVEATNVANVTIVQPQGSTNSIAASGFAGNPVTGSENQAHNHNFSWSGTTDNGNGGGSSHNNIHPCQVVNFFIKT